MTAFSSDRSDSHERNGRRWHRRAWFEVAVPADYPGLALPDPSERLTWSCTVEYDDHADSRYDTFTNVLDWALAEGSVELWVWSPAAREFEQFSRSDEARLREVHA